MKVDKSKIKKTAKVKTQARASKKTAQSLSKKSKRRTATKPDTGRKVVAGALPEKFTGDATDSAMSAYAALHDEFAIASAWDILGDEDYVLDDEIWNSLYNRIKLQLLQTTYGFRVESEGATLSPYAVTTLPAFRGHIDPGYISTGNFTLLRPEVPGVVFDLRISANEMALSLDWLLTRADAKPAHGHMALYLDGTLIEATNLQQSRCRISITREDAGEATFYFLDDETGKQTKILDLSI